MSSGSFKVKIFDAKGTQVVPLAKSTLTVGSAAHCDIVLPHASIQPEHIRAWIDGGRIWIQDLSTSTGTTLNGIRLPVLKPMLVREMDVVKLGDCPATLGLEANFVRAPVFRQPPPVEEVTATDIRAIETKEDHAAKKIEALSHELADLKAQIQRSKSVDEETGRQLAKVRQELLLAQEQNQKMAETVGRIDKEKQSERENLENEVAELKLKALRDLKDQRDYQRRQITTWKDQSLVEVSRQIRQLSRTKTKTWVNRPLSQEQILDWEADVNQIVRRVLLDEASERAEVTMPSIEVPPAAPPPPPPPTNLALPPPPLVQEELEVTSPSITTGKIDRFTQSGIRKGRSKAADSLVRYLLGGLGSVCIVGLAYLNWPVVGRIVSFRSVASTSPSRVAEDPKPAAPKPMINPPVPRPAALASVNEGPYQPQQTKMFKKSYSENMVFTAGFEGSEVDMEFRRKWIAEMSKKAKSWKVDSEDLSWAADKELKLILDLRRMKTAIISQSTEKAILEKMLKREEVFLKELEGRLKSKQVVEKFLKLKAGFYSRNAR